MSSRGNSGQRDGRGRGRGGDGGPPGRGGGGPGSSRGRGFGDPTGRGSPPISERGRGQGAATPPFEPPASGFRGGTRGRGAAGANPEARGRGFGGEPRGRGFVPGGGGRGAGDGGSGPRGGFGRGAPSGRGASGPLIFSENVPAQLPARLSDASHQQLMTTFKSIKASPDRPLRPGYGTLGTPITLRANFFPVKVPKGPIYDYSVDINPKTDIKRMKNRIFQLLEESALCRPHIRYIAHDRSQRLVSARKLPQPLDITFPFIEEDETEARPKATVYTVSIKFDRELDTTRLTRYLDGQTEARDYDPLPLISALNIVLQQHPAKNGVRVGTSRYYFPPSPGHAISLGPGVEAWQGFFTSVRPVYKQLMVNVNVCLTAFVEPGNLADALRAFNRNSMGAMATLPDALVGSIRVKTRHLGYKKPLKAVHTKSARSTFFDCAEFGGEISVEDYFKRKYKITLQHPTDLPVVNIGSRAKPNYIPAELCDIERGLPYHAKLNDRETAQMIRYACNPPRVNAETIINEGFPKLGMAPLESPADGFGISIDTEMAIIPARELRPPRLTYQAGNASVRNGSWNILDVKFHRGARIASWWVMAVRDGAGMLQGPDDPKLTGLVSGFAAKCRKSGMLIPEGSPRLLVVALQPYSQRDPRRTGALKQIKAKLQESLNASNGQKPGFVLVLLENRDNFIYPGIKRIGDVEMGIQTVHMQLGKALGDPRKQDQYFSNVALKVNTKLGGMNHLLDAQAMKWLTKKKTMMVGIDVTHPTGLASKQGSPSVAAVVASVDDSFVQFPASIGIQRSGKEMLDCLRDMLVERLLLYEKKNKVLPERIFVFRDGVSEGQFDIVLREELAQILEAFKRLETQERKTRYRPRLSIVICGKRHHARFFPTSSQFADRNGNTQPGTVVDKGVTAVFDFDFYLQAHAGLQGTVKATHYTVVYDENGFTADEVQQGTHDASYLYARATKAVSLIPAAYYADLACERGRCYLNDFLVESGSKAGSSDGGKGRRETEEEKAKVFIAAKKTWGEGLHPDMRTSMFYI